MSNADEILYKEALINAFKYGSAEVKIVFKKIMANYPNLREKSKELFSKLEKIVKEVNSFSEEKIAEIVENKFPEEIIVEKKERVVLPDLPNAVEGKVVVRYPPEPSKHPHIGQMLSFCINHLIAEKYKGRRVLRFDDTNPERIKEEFYEGFREAISWMELKIDQEVLASNYMDTYYEKAEGLIKNGDAFVCSCEREAFSKLRAEGKSCQCNLNNATEKNIDLFEQMMKGEFSVGEAVLRLRGDMQSDNSALRDPVLLRISEFPHAIQGDKYHIWPMYDFESPIMEEITGVTHIFRSIEFGKMREELQSLISKKLNIIPPEFYEYSRFNIIGAPTQGRVIRELVEEGVVNGWDDYRLVTYQALKNRGIQPQVFSEIVERVGITKSTTNIDWSLIFSINRKIIEPRSKHYFFVDEPIEIVLLNPEPVELEISLHPYNKDLGKRKVKVNETLYLSGTDKKLLKENEILRMKDLYNIKIVKKINEKKYEAEIFGDELLPKIPRLQWVSEPVKIEIVKPEMLYLNNRINKDSLEYITGFGEKSISNLKIGEIVQLERFGYTKVNKKNDKIKMNYIHG
ncbi:MAG: glutamate--tRNA ligase [Candidatus Heimdallarchaeota archaeon]|nr:glutamate--tRNA ligase [Candidatus Heimdallarchaeota archaeon]MCK4769047.1 glutamate--tRNA ligase [Candidatus Heimdallarchaeota archaeon]